jgi:hypothetical protein
MLAPPPRILMQYARQGAVRLSQREDAPAPDPPWGRAQRRRGSSVTRRQQIGDADDSASSCLRSPAPAWPAPIASDWGDSHIFNDHWPAHARFHGVTALALAASLSAANVWSAWSGAADRDPPGSSPQRSRWRTGHRSSRLRSCRAPAGTTRRTRPATGRRARQPARRGGDHRHRRCRLADGRLVRNRRRTVIDAV